MRTMPSGRDDPVTVVSIAVLACLVQDVLHEGLGHGVTAWLAGAKTITISTVAMQSEVSSRWIEMSGTLVNLAAALVLLLALRAWSGWRPRTRYFLVLALAGNLFTATGYFLFSGVTDFGDWAAVIQGLPGHGLWRMALIVGGAGAYWVSMMIVGHQLRAFGAGRVDIRRVRLLCWTPYAAEGALALLGGLWNPAGLFYVVASALPSTLGANAGLLSLPSILARRPAADEQVGPVSRSMPWIAAGAVAAIAFIVILGRGLTWTRT